MSNAESTDILVYIPKAILLKDFVNVASEEKFTILYCSKFLQHVR